MARDASMRTRRTWPPARQAANTAMDEIDAMLPRAVPAPGAAVGEIRAADDATAARVDELLRQCREERGQ